MQKIYRKISPAFCGARKKRRKSAAYVCKTTRSFHRNFLPDAAQTRKEYCRHARGSGRYPTEFATTYGGKLRRKREGKPEGRALSQPRALHTNFSPVRFHNFLRNGEPQPPALFFGGSVNIGLVELLEDFFFFAVQHAGAVVGNFEYQLVIILVETHLYASALR